MEHLQVNPIVPGFSPDPSLVYVDGIYFLVNSSFHMFPGLPVYASADMKTWKHIGNAVNRQGQLDLQRSFTKLWGPPNAHTLFPCQGGLYAPTIRYHNGIFYIICTNVQHDKELPIEKSVFSNFILSTSNIWANEWSDPVFFDFHGIDTSIFWDDDHRVYIVGSKSPATPSPRTEIYQFEIDLATGQKLSDEKLLWEGVSRIFPEGPHIYKKDGWYYLLIAEGGCFADHHTLMARARNIWGPYDVNPQNPVLPKADPSGYVQYTGHGDLFQEPSTGQWYFCCLGVRKTKAGRAIMGRETFLTTARWLKGEYPVIDPVQLGVLLPAKQGALAGWSAFEGAGSFTPRVDFLHIRNPTVQNYQYRDRQIILTASKDSLDQAVRPVTFVGKRQRQLIGAASATLNAGAVDSHASSLQCGLCYYKDEHRFSRIFLDLQSQQIIWNTVNKAKFIEHQVGGSARDVLSAGLSAGVLFGIRYTEERLEFSYTLTSDGEMGETIVLGCLDTLDLTADEFVGPVIGIFATGEADRQVVFSDFSVD